MDRVTVVLRVVTQRLRDLRDVLLRDATMPGYGSEYQRGVRAMAAVALEAFQHPDPISTALASTDRQVERPAAAPGAPRALLQALVAGWDDDEETAFNEAMEQARAYLKEHVST